MIIKLWLALCLALTVCVGHTAATEKLATAADLAVIQQQLQTQVQELAIHKHTLQVSLEATDKRLADFATLATMQGSHTTWVGNLVALVSGGITLLVLIGGFLTYRNAKADAKKEAKKEALKWLDKRTEHLTEQIQQLQQQAAEAKASIAKDVDTVKAGTQQHTEALKDAQALIERTNTKEQPDSPQRPADLQTTHLVQQASDELKAKAERDFSADDHYIRGVSLYASGNFQGALTSFEAAIHAAKNAPAADQTKYLFAKAVALGSLDKSEEAIVVYDEIDQRFGKDESPGIREQVGKGLVNKGVTLSTLGKSKEAIGVYDEIDQRFGKDESPGIRKLVVTGLVNKGGSLGILGKSEEAIVVYDEIERRFGKDQTSGVRGQVANALNGLGFNKIMLAKERWPDETQRQALLSSATSVLEHAIAFCNSNDRAMILGNLGYGLFLAGQPPAAQAPTLECLKLGGPKALETQRGDTNRHRVEPQDSDYEKMLDELRHSLPAPSE